MAAVALLGAGSSVFSLSTAACTSRRVMSRKRADAMVGLVWTLLAVGAQGAVPHPSSDKGTVSSWSSSVCGAVALKLEADIVSTSTIPCDNHEEMITMPAC